MTAGPSPRAWGLRTLEAHSACGQPVHPHVRGVYTCTLILHAYITGPSPRAWGLLVVFGEVFHDGRSIPTCVGFTAGQEPPERGVSVHPHVRGVYMDNALLNLQQIGPSPRAWGLRLGSVCWRQTAAVHPHVRGDYLSGPVNRKRDVRSIPTCVGFTLAPASIFSCSRSIPTCVGFTLK